MVILDENDGYVTLINTFKVKDGRAEDLLALLRKATDERARFLPGFVSANLHVSLDGTRVVNYAQWRSQAAFEAAMRNPEFQTHMKAAAQMAESFEPVLYALRYSEGGPAGIAQPSGEDRPSALG